MAVRKYSRKRDAILECVRSTTEHPAAEWVYSHLKDEFPDLSLATVYRNLAMFKEEGLVESLGTVGGILALLGVIALMLGCVVGTLILKKRSRRKD